MFQVAADTGGGFQAERAPTRQQDAVHPGIDVAWIEGRNLLRPARRAADIHAAHRALLAQNRGASGNRLEVRNVAHTNSRNVREPFHSVS